MARLTYGLARLQRTLHICDCTYGAGTARAKVHIRIHIRRHYWGALGCGATQRTVGIPAVFVASSRGRTFPSVCRADEGPRRPDGDLDMQRDGERVWRRPWCFARPDSFANRLAVGGMVVRMGTAAEPQSGRRRRLVWPRARHPGQKPTP